MTMLKPTEIALLRQLAAQSTPTMPSTRALADAIGQPKSSVHLAVVALIAAALITADGAVTPAGHREIDALEAAQAVRDGAPANAVRAAIPLDAIRPSPPEPPQTI